MVLLKDGHRADDAWHRIEGEEALPASGPIIVDLQRWQQDREALLGRVDAVGVRLQSDEDPESLVPDLDRLALIALDFPGFKDGRAYSSARVLRERLGFKGELRAVGDVLLE
ncbi:DUF934 domain-containing protein, partial [Myxococcota bacterium]|nr:DUF934 domain-containing protein [Myxococcota bacterium]